MTKRDKLTPEDDRMVRDDAAPWGERMSAVRMAGVDHLTYLEADVVRLLGHEFEGLRAAAITTLVLYWELERHVPKALEMLRDDPEPLARRHAASALGVFLTRTGGERERVLRALALALRTDADLTVAREAWVQLLATLAPERKASEVPEDDFDRERHVDWSLLAPHLPN